MEQKADKVVSGEVSTEVTGKTGIDGKTADRSQKRMPERRCMGCGKTGEKKAFIRSVATKDGSVSVDLSGKVQGRGAYLCKDLTCLEKAKKRHAFSRSFRCEISEKSMEEFETVFCRIMEAEV